jgi:1,4-alpha-glucan branching enzyme
MGHGMICIAHFSPEKHTDYRIGVSQKQEYHIVFCSDAAKYGGSEQTDTAVKTSRLRTGDKPYTLTVSLPPLSFMVLSGRK